MSLVIELWLYLRTQEANAAPESSKSLQFPLL